MAKPVLRVSVLFALSILLLIQGSTSLDQENLLHSSQTQLKKQESLLNMSLDPDFSKIPLYFIPNEGQVNEKAIFYSKTSRYSLWLTKEGLIFDSLRKAESSFKEYGDRANLHKHEMLGRNAESEKYERDVSRLIFLNANKNSEILPLDLTEHRVNYFIGDDKDKWKSDISTSKVVLYKNLYKNVDLKVYGVERQIEYDWIVKPGGNPEEITFIYKDIKGTKIDDERNLLVETLFGQLMHKKPVSYQVIGGERIEVDVSFRVIGKDTYGFKVNAYEKDYDLIIDPLVLTYSTYLGGNSSDHGYDIVVDSSGNAYVTGETGSTDFPTKNAFQADQGEWDVFVTKLSSSGSSLIYSTFLGGNSLDEGQGIEVDSSGNAYITGRTESTDFPTKNAFQADFKGEWDVFVTKLSSTGSRLVYSTYLGGNSYDPGRGIAVDSSGNAYVTGGTGSTDFPTKNAFQTDQGEWDAFVTKLSSSGSSLVYSTYLGGGDDDEGRDIAVDGSGNAYVIGGTESTDFPTKNAFQANYQGGNYDAFMTKLSSSGSSLVYSTYLGGGYTDDGLEIAVDSSGDAYVTGRTSSTDFPTQNAFQANFQGSYDAFVTKLSSTGSNLVYSTYLGGGEHDIGLDIAVDSSENAYVTGGTKSTDFPTKNSFQANFQGSYDAFVTKLSSTGSSLVYSTYLGGNLVDFGEGIAVDSSGDAYVIGRTESTDFPTKNAFQANYQGGDFDAFVTKLSCTTYSLIITAGNGGTTDPSPGTYTHDKETEVTITAIPNSGYTFSGWSGDASGTTNPITITMDSDKSIIANFTEESEGGGGGGDGGRRDSPGGDGCFIATACYGTTMAEELKTLCAFRDQYLITNPIGKSLVNLYYYYSPKVADFIRDKEDLKIVLRECLKPVIWTVKRVVE